MPNFSQVLRATGTAKLTRRGGPDVFVGDLFCRRFSSIAPRRRSGRPRHSNSESTNSVPSQRLKLIICYAAPSSNWTTGTPEFPPAKRRCNSHPRTASTISGWAGFTEKKPTAPASSKPPAWPKKVHVEFEKAVELAPDNWEARTDLAEFYLEAPGMVGGSEEKARAQADALLALNPGMAHWVRARIAQKHKNNDDAEQEYHLAIEASHGGARAWVSLAGFYHKTNRLDEMDHALLTLESSKMESRPLDRPAALMDAASMLLRSDRDYPLATRLVRRYLASPTDEEWPAFKAHYVLGELLEKQNDRSGAAEEYRASLAMAHNFSHAQQGLSRVDR